MGCVLGFKLVQVLLEAESVSELDEAFRMLNDSYPVIRCHLEVLGEINGFEKGKGGF